MEKHKVVVFSDATGSIDGHYKVEKRKGCEGGKNQLVKVFFLTRFIVRGWYARTLMLVKKTELNYRMRPDGGTFKNDEKRRPFRARRMFQFRIYFRSKRTYLSKIKIPSLFILGIERGATFLWQLFGQRITMKNFDKVEYRHWFDNFRTSGMVPMLDKPFGEMAT